MIFKKGDVTWDGEQFRFKIGVYPALKKFFADKDVETEVRKASRWALYNPPKKNWTKFVCNWLNRANGIHAIKRENERVAQSVKPRDSFVPIQLQTEIEKLANKMRMR